ncbi:MAG: hypothetical protein QHI38_02460 [Armatimonadota bacterium]|nr:hypothetical protein [Armatimonadota bacterium]
MHLGWRLACAAISSAAVLNGGTFAAVKIENTKYSQYGNVVKLTNGIVDVMVTTDFGPRIIYYGFCGGPNILGELPKTEAVKTEFGEWHPYGGHRLWAAPEAMPRSYWPDNDPVQVEVMGDSSVKLTPPLEKGTGIQKRITVTMSRTGTGVTVLHEITNKNVWPVELACWALTIMNGGGTTIFPQEPFKPHGEVLLPARPLALWNYTDMTDPRWTFGKKFVLLRTDAARDFPQKIGAAVKAGWAAYLREGILFIKRFPYHEGASYPDFGCNFETFTKGTFMEVESLGPLVKLEPDKTVTHVEKWFLFKDCKAGDSEESLSAAIEPLLESAK